MLRKYFSDVRCAGNIVNFCAQEVNKQWLICLIMIVRFRLPGIDIDDIDLPTGDRGDRPSHDAHIDLLPGILYSTSGPLVGFYNRTPLYYCV